MDYLAEAFRAIKGTNLRILTKYNGKGEVVNWKVIRCYGGQAVACGSRASEKALYQLVLSCKGSARQGSTA